MKVTRITIAVVGTLTMLLFAPFDAKASIQGVGQSSHFNGQHFAHHQFRHRHLVNGRGTATTMCSPIHPIMI